MSNQKNLGVSSQEYEDAVILEKLYSLLSYTNKCSDCRKRKPTHINCDSHQFICKPCTKGIDNCKEIGVDRISSNEIRKLEKRYKSTNVKSKSNRDNTRSRRVRTPSPSSNSESSYSEPSRHRQISSRHHSSTPRSRKLKNGNFDADPSIPGMRNLLLGNPQQQNQFFSTPPQNSLLYNNTNPNGNNTGTSNWNQGLLSNTGVYSTTNMNNSYGLNPNTGINTIAGMNSNPGIVPSTLGQVYPSSSYPNPNPYTIQTSTYNSQMISPQQKFSNPSVNFPSSTVNYPNSSVNYPNSSVNYPNSSVNYPNSSVNFPNNTKFNQYPYNSNTYQMPNNLTPMYSHSQPSNLLYPNMNSIMTNPSNLRPNSYSYTNPYSHPTQNTTQPFTYPTNNQISNQRTNPALNNFINPNLVQPYFSNRITSNPFNSRTQTQHLPGASVTNNPFSM